MKKIIGFAAVTAILALSCGKERTCECRTQFESEGGVYSIHYADTLISGGKKKAAKVCNGLDSDRYLVNGQVTWLNCEIKE